MSIIMRWKQTDLLELRNCAYFPSRYILFN